MAKVQFFSPDRQPTDGQNRLLNPASRMRARGKNYAYPRVPSKSSKRTSKYGNLFFNQRHNDDIKTQVYVFCGSDVRSLTLTQRSAFDLAAVKWPSERVTVKAICHKNVVDLKIPGPLTVWRRLLRFQNGNT